jgi:TPR repeat protein
MKQETFFRATAIGAVLLVTVVLSMAQAQDYNDGLLAAKAGDYNTAVMKWQPLARQGDAMAQFNLALMYHRGLGVGIDEARAVAWYKMSAENGYIKAQEFLAAAYREGWFGLPHDQNKAGYWLQRLEEQSL